MSSLPAAPARTTLVEAPHLGDLIGVRTVVIRVPAANDQAVRSGVPAVALMEAGPSAMCVDRQVGVLALSRVLVEMTAPQAASGAVSAGRIVAGTVLLVAGQIVRASEGARC